MKPFSAHSSKHTAPRAVVSVRPRHALLLLPLLLLPCGA